MRFEVKVEELAASCGLAARAVAGRVFRPALGALHLLATPTGVVVTGTDGDLTISAEVAAQVDKTGAIAVPARRLVELLSRCGKGSLTVEGVDGEARLQWQRTRGTMQGVAEFPEVQWPATWTPVPGLREAATWCVFAAARGENDRPLLTGVNLSKEGALASDAFQFAHYAQALDVDATVPAHALTVLGQVVSAGEVEVAMHPEGGQVCFRSGAVRVATRTLEGKYFDILGIVPRKWSTTVVVERAELLGALGRVLTVSEAAPTPVRCVIREDGLTLVASSGGNTVEEDVAATVTGDLLQPSLNGQQWMHALRSFAGETLTARLTGPESLVLWGEGDDKCFGQMPLQVPEVVNEVEAESA